MDVTLRPLTVDDEAAATAVHQELAASDGFIFLLGWEPGQSWANHLAHIEQVEAGAGLGPGRVRAAFRVADVDGELAGRISIRYELNEWLSRLGGHVGYGVRPRFRRRGVASGMLRGALPLLHEHGIPRALVTCDADNAGSAAVIERCGGVFERVEPDEKAPKRRYWIPTATVGPTI